MSSPVGVREQFLEFGGRRLTYDGDPLVWNRSNSSSIDAFLPMDLLKTHLQMPLSDTGQDTVLDVYRKAAVTFCEMHIGRPILSSTKDKTVQAQGEDPMVLGERFLSSITCIQYWTNRSAYVSGPPDAGIPSNELGRISYRGRGRAPSTQMPELEAELEDSYIVFPAVRWPDSYENLFVATLDVGMDATSVGYEEARMASIMMAREYFEGYRTIGPNHAVYRILEPLKEW